MELGTISSAAGKLLAALEKSGISNSADLRSSLGPSGSPDPELVRAFENALAQGPAEGSSHIRLVSGTGYYEAELHAPGVPEQGNFSQGQGPQELSSVSQTDQPELRLERTEQIAPAQDTPAPHPGQNTQPPGPGTIHELQHIFDRMNAGQLSAEDLFRMQYLIGMLKVQTESGLQASQKAAQGFDSLLKQQG
ncbi:MAG: hypothetical protein GX055_07785 [Desulfovibrionales bacterium]|nr:hypothetical protein [Desulfovibrionales bacterium]